MERQFISIGPKAKDITGLRSGRLVALGPVGRYVRPDGNGTEIIWQCRCDCGKEHDVFGKCLRFKQVRSCGCLNQEKRSERAKRRSFTGTGTVPEQNIWRKMINRCYNSAEDSYPGYGARGIRVCDMWRDDFMAFYRDMGSRPSRLHSIERIDNDKDYGPDNCRWATRLEQANNKRNNLWIEAFGRRQTLSQWAREVGKKAWLIRQRIVDSGWPPEKALTEPYVAHKHRKCNPNRRKSEPDAFLL